MRKLSLLFISILFICVKVNAQDAIDKKIDQVMFLFVDEKYDKVIDKAGFLTENDKFRKEPLPYLYLAMGYYEISRRPGEYDIEDKYKKPLKYAQKYTYKFLKKDKKKEYVDDYTEFFEALTDTSNKLGQHFFALDKARKAASVYKYAYRANPNDPILLLWQGISEIKSMNLGEGERNVLAALEKINKDFKPSVQTRGVLAHGMLLVEEHFAQKGDTQTSSKAKELVEVFKKYDPDELDKKKMEERKKKAKEDDKVIRKFYSEDDDDDDE